MRLPDFSPASFTASRHASTPIAVATTAIRSRSSEKNPQDRFDVNSKLLTKRFAATCVCDGHGPEGDVVAEAEAVALMGALEDPVALQVDVGRAVKEVAAEAERIVEGLAEGEISGSAFCVAAYPAN